MKRIIAIILLAALSLALIGCGYFQPLDKDGMVRPTEAVSDKFDFTSTDIEGNTVAFSDFADRKVIMLNMWESWCGPCVGEIPDIIKLYDKYAADGFVVIGAYGNSGDSEVRSVIKELEIDYPVVRATAGMRKFDTGYVPTTVFFDGEGNRLTESYVGAKSYAEWERIILGLLGK